MTFGGVVSTVPGRFIRGLPARVAIIRHNGNSLFGKPHAISDAHPVGPCHDRGRYASRTIDDGAEHDPVRGRVVMVMTAFGFGLARQLWGGPLPEQTRFGTAVVSRREADFRAQVQTGPGLLEFATARQGRTGAGPQPGRHRLTGADPI